MLSDCFRHGLERYGLDVNYLNFIDQRHRLVTRLVEESQLDAPSTAGVTLWNFFRARTR